MIPLSGKSRFFSRSMTASQRSKLINLRGLIKKKESRSLRGIPSDEASLKAASSTPLSFSCILQLCGSIQTRRAKRLLGIVLVEPLNGSGSIVKVAPAIFHSAKSPRNFIRFQPARLVPTLSQLPPPLHSSTCVNFASGGRSSRKGIILATFWSQRGRLLEIALRYFGE